MRKIATLFAVVLVGIFLVSPAIAGHHEMADDDDNKFTVHGNFWTRGFYSDNFDDFDDTIDDEWDAFFFRARIGVKADLGSNVFVYTELQNFDSWGHRDSESAGSPIGRSRPPLRDVHDSPADDGVCSTLGCEFLGVPDTDDRFENIELYQGFIALKEVGGTSFSFKLGRQEIKMGSELILGDLDWYGGISHDGFVGGWDLESFDITLLYTRVDRDSDFGDDNEEDFWGAWVDFGWGDSGVDTTVYAFNNRDDSALSNFWTGGFRVWDYAEDHKGFSWSVEYAMQTGDFSSTVDMDASVIEGWIAYGFGNGRDQSVHLGYTSATGDDTSSATDFESFDPLFQDFHYRLGLADFFATSNIEAIEVGYKLALNDNNKVGIDYYMFSLEEDNGAVAGDDLGTEIDLWYKYKHTENLDYNVGLAYFSPDDAITGVGGIDDNGTQLWAQIRARF